MPIVNFSNVTTIILAVILFTLLLILGKETKKSQILAIMLFVFLGLLVGHSIELLTFNYDNTLTYECIRVSLIFDFIFILLSFISYLWIDDIQAKNERKKSIDNSLEWFWREI